MNRLETCHRHVCEKKLKPPIKVTVTGAAGNIGYSLVFMIGQGRLLGPDQPVILTLLEIPQVKKILDGVVMELTDSAYPLLTQVNGVTNYEDGFRGCQIAILVGAKPRGPGMERSDLLGQNAEIFRGQGKALNDYADRNCKILVVGNPANTNAMICQQYAPNIPPENFTALTRLDQNRAVCQIANRIGTNVANIQNTIIWGNHSVTQYVDVTQGVVNDFPQKGQVTSIVGAVSDDKWIQTEFLSTVQKRGAAVLALRKLTSAGSAASSICDHVREWVVGTQPNHYASMGVLSDGSYGIPKGIVFSFPVQCKDGKWQIVQGLKWSEFSQKMILLTTKELMEEKMMAQQYLEQKK